MNNLEMCLETVSCSEYRIRGNVIADGRCDASKVGIIGFSRGGLLTLQAGASQATKVKAIISMAPAQANGELDNILADVSAFDDPILILVAENDLIQDDHVQLAQMAYDSLFNNGKNFFVSSSNWFVV